MWRRTSDNYEKLARSGCYTVPRPSTAATFCSSFRNEKSLHTLEVQSPVGKYCVYHIQYASFTLMTLISEEQLAHTY